MTDMCGPHLIFEILPSFLHLLIFLMGFVCCPHAAANMSPPPELCSTPDSSLSISMDHTNTNTNSKRAEKGGGGGAEEEEEEDDVVEWVLMEECWSEAEEGCAVRFIKDPYSSLLVFQSSSSYITINGNEETCGSSFSDCGTSLMATLHSTTPMHHHAFLSNARHDHDDNNDDDDDDDDHMVLHTFLGFREHENEELLPPNSQL